MKDPKTVTSAPGGDPGASSLKEEPCDANSFEAYMRPVELYNLIHDRAQRNATFLPRNLNYLQQSRALASAEDRTRRHAYPINLSIAADWAEFSRPASSNPQQQELIDSIGNTGSMDPTRTAIVVLFQDDHQPRSSTASVSLVPLAAKVVRVPRPAEGPAPVVTLYAPESVERSELSVLLLLPGESALLDTIKKPSARQVAGYAHGKIFGLIKDGSMARWAIVAVSKLRSVEEPCRCAAESGEGGGASAEACKPEARPAGKGKRKAAGPGSDAGSGGQCSGPGEGRGGGVEFQCGAVRHALVRDLVDTAPAGPAAPAHPARAVCITITPPRTPASPSTLPPPGWWRMAVVEGRSEGPSTAAGGSSSGALHPPAPSQPSTVPSPNQRTGTSTQPEQCLPSSASTGTSKQGRHSPSSASKEQQQSNGRGEHSAAQEGPSTRLEAHAAGDAPANTSTLHRNGRKAAARRWWSTQAALPEGKGGKRVEAVNTRGQVWFLYMYDEDRKCKRELVEHWRCPFCLMPGGSFKGLEYHLLATHDQFAFDFHCQTAQGRHVLQPYCMVSVWCKIQEVYTAAGNYRPLESEQYLHPINKEFDFVSHHFRPRTRTPLATLPFLPAPSLGYLNQTDQAVVADNKVWSPGNPSERGTELDVARFVPSGRGRGRGQGGGRGNSACQSHPVVEAEWEAAGSSAALGSSPRGQRGRGGRGSMGSASTLWKKRQQEAGYRIQQLRGARGGVHKMPRGGALARLRAQQRSCPSQEGFPPPSSTPPRLTRRTRDDAPPSDAHDPSLLNPACQQDVGKAEVSKADGGKAEASKADVGKAEVSKAEGSKAEGSKAEGVKADGGKGEGGKKKKRAGEAGTMGAAASKKGRSKEMAGAPHPAALVGEYPKLYHSQTAQAMSHAEMEACYDSDDLKDDQDWERERKRCLDDFIDITTEDKDFMHLWNTFVHKHPIFADLATPHACAQFATVHAEQLKGTMRRCFVFHLFNLWDFGLVSGPVINYCLQIVDHHANASPSSDTPANGPADTDAIAATD